MAYFRTLLFMFLAHSAHASELAVTVPVSRGITERELDLSTKVENVVNCIRENGHKKDLKGESNSAKLSRYNFERIKIYLAKEISLHRKETSNEELALFLSQIFHESWGFTAMNERAAFRDISGHTYRHEDIERNAMATVQENRAQGKEKYFRTETKYGPRYRGRGIVQLTGCSNYLTFLHYINTGYARWNETWIISDEAAKKLESKKDLIRVNGGYQINMVCSDEVLNAINEEYKSKWKKDLDHYGVLDDPDTSFVPGVTLQKEGGEKITGDELLAKTAMAYWGGKPSCQAKIEKIVAAEQGTGIYNPSEPECSKYEDSAICARIADITRCVNGGLNGLEDRVKWYKVAQACSALNF